MLLVMFGHFDMRRTAFIASFVMVILLAAIKAGPRLAQNVATTGLTQDWLSFGSSLLPPCGMRSVKYSYFSQATTPSKHATGAYKTARGRALWLEGQCREAQRYWVAAGEDGYQLASIYLLYTDRWEDIPAPLRSYAARYAAAMGSVAQNHGSVTESFGWYYRSWYLLPKIETAQWLANYHLSQGAMRKAVEVWATTRNAYSNEMSEYWLAAGKIASLNEDWSQAAELYGKGVALSSQPTQLLLLQAEAFERAGLLADAEKAYAATVAADPQEATSYAALVALAIQRGNQVGAQEWQQKAARVFDSPTEALNLGYAYLRRKQAHIARPYLEKAYMAGPSDFWTTYLWAQVLHDEGESDNAVALLREAIKLHPGRPGQWQRQLGDWYMAIGDREAARSAYQTALKWGEDSIELRAVLEKLK